ncbi:MAG TPA: winged helix-turn-helix domain-containing protein [Gaiellaceae bacterium]|jgi:DNA-binding MarR family transcriptional regulator|nr:winged helix-turn-helix domain-containing protein [Gaiellaceae bacterium]
MSSTENEHTWRFLSNHTQVLLCISRDPNMRFRDIAQIVGITERATQRIVADLIDAGYIDRERVGRRNRYHLNTDIKMRHAAQADHEIGELLNLFELPAGGDSRPAV